MRIALGLVLVLAFVATTNIALAKGGGGTPPKAPKPAPPPKPAAPAPGAKPKECVELATSWEGAIALARAMNVPILLHAHAFASAVSWDMHDNVMCSPTFIAFAVDNCVDVIVLRGIEDGVANKDPRAATYEVKLADGHKARYLVELPGLTVADLAAIEASKAGTLNESGQAPFTAVVDPWTEGAGQKWTADAGQSAITTAVLAAKIEQERWHGKADHRADVKALFAAVADAEARTAKGDFSGAVVAVTTVKGSKSNASERFKKAADDAVAKAVREAQRALDEIDAKKASDPAGARKSLSELLPKLGGTGLEARAKAALESLK